uniref:PAZ domain-containing protein n=1 Tax=Caenorhabditis tropicalis TaxID=1561998 RepID=A0A1I7TI24_9PELO
MGPRFFTCLHRQAFVYGTIQVSVERANYSFHSRSGRETVSSYYLRRYGLLLRSPRHRLVYVREDPGSLLPSELLRFRP